MEFRKESHRTDMPALIMCTVDPFGKHARPKGLGFSTFGDSRWSHIEKISTEQVFFILQQAWPTASMNDAEATIEELVHYEHLRLVGTTYIIRRQSPPPATRPNVPSTSYRRFGKRGINKSGICPRCGRHAENKNRHANPGHGTECQLNKCRDVHES